MGVKNQIDRIKNNVKNTYTALTRLGVNLPTNQNSDNLAATVGTFSLDNELTTQDELIAEIKSVLQNKAAGGGGGFGDIDLPTGYVRTNYIKFNSKQIIDTGIIGNKNTEVRARYTRENTGSAYMYGCASSDNTAAITAYFGGNWRFGSKAASVSPTISADLINTVIQNSSGIDRISATSSYSGVADFETIGTLLLGACRNSSGTVPSATYNGKVFMFEIYKSGTLVLKLVPVVSADGVYRFYDMVSKEFFDSITSTPLDGGNL